MGSDLNRSPTLRSVPIWVEALTLSMAIAGASCLCEMNRRRDNGSTDVEKGLLWKLPQVRLKDVGKVGPAFGIGAGCGLGFGLGIIGGAGFGPGIPGLQIGFGFGAGCGVGLGFGYGVGRGVAYDENRSYSNVGQLFNAQHTLPTQDDIDSLIDEIVINTKKLVRATTREIEKWRR